MKFPLDEEDQRVFLHAIRPGIELLPPGTAVGIILGVPHPKEGEPGQLVLIVNEADDPVNLIEQGLVKARQRIPPDATVSFEKGGN